MKQKKILIDESVYDYLHYYNKDEAEEILLEILDKTKDLSGAYIKPLIQTLRRGNNKSKIVLAKCTSNQFYAVVKRMASGVLSPFSGFDAVSSLIVKMMEEDTAMYIGGRFSPIENDIVVVIDRVNGRVGSKYFLSVIYHELMHYASCNYTKDFKTIFFNMLFKYYINMFAIIQEVAHGKILDNNNKLARVFIKNMLIVEGSEVFYKKDKVKQSINSTYDMLYDIDSKSANVWATLFMDAYSVRKYEDLTQHVTYGAYQRSGFQVPSGLYHHYQELIFPSEVIAILSSSYPDKEEFINMLNVCFK